MHLKRFLGAAENRGGATFKVFQDSPQCQNKDEATRQEKHPETGHRRGRIVLHDTVGYPPKSLWNDRMNRLGNPSF